MENKWLHKVKQLTQKFQIKNERRLVIYLMCVGIASLFWLLNALEKDYSVELSFPVRYTNIPKSKTLVNTPPKNFVLQVRSGGFTILRYKLSVAFSPLVFNVGEIAGEQINGTQKNNYAISSRYYRKKMSDQISNELNLISIQPDTVYLEFDRILTQKKKVVADVSLAFKKQHYLYDEILVTPDSIEVLGPESILDTLPHVKTNSQHYKDLEHPIQRNVSLQKIKNLEFNPNRVTIQIPVEEFTEKQLVLPIQIDSLPRKTHVHLFPAEVKVTFLVSLSRFSDIQASDFRASVSYQDIRDNQDYLPVQLDQSKVPVQLKGLTYAPMKIEYLIEN
ncbi:hypothetical protein [uncultured Sunxiuqinia sp.]|uniref:hypothetical protein n=1 Tax=Sunxiuqinia rutila TaxID=1397841 RepID=UPI002603849E|nr:hypothetical protein [uncultured Sunxiuqinia sp.]